MSARILLIGQGLFLDGLTRILTEQPDTEIIAAVNTWVEGRQIVDQDKPNIVIVDHEQPDLRQSDLAPLLESETTSLKVVFLTLSANKMIVHERQHLTDVSVPDLIQALQLPAGEEDSAA
jgi:DNA-binding NarL/FixJ family response regulator